MLKTKNKTLYIILGVLAVVVAVNLIRDNLRGERSFANELLSFDPQNVSTLMISHSDDVITFEKVSGVWMVSNKENQKYRADQSSVENIIKDLSNIKIERLVSRDKSQWKEYEVDDSLGTTVTLLNNKKNLGEIVIGRFSYRQSGYGGVQLSTMVRQPKSNDVYSVEGALSFSIKRDFQSFRDKTILNIEPDLVQQIEFSYPGDSSFTLTKTNNLWLMGVDTVTTGKVLNYLNDIKDTRASSIAETTPEQTEQFQLKISMNNLPPITVKAFKHQDRYMFITTQNEAILTDAEYLFKRLFVSKQKFKN